ncbi:MAG TPA: formate dehydrogenase accessory sulfurtransferase FdhD [Candidatus Polarisedimenticolaceae bacterium]|nr:formate dehydrogenase accessory sulfurtransferase FdhD [Candidatus Polarisedimenticolaceae bacterium]
MSGRADSTSEARIIVFDDGRREARSDDLATEEPLEIRLRAASRNENDTLPLHGPRRPAHRAVAVTMRTPGADAELAAGFLYGEGVLRKAEEISAVGYCDDPSVDEAKRLNIVNVDLLTAELPDLEALHRHFHVSSACGVCGKTSLDALRLNAPAPIGPGPVVPAASLTTLPEKLRSEQGIFATTGGLHAAGLFDESGELLAVREDVGRHNAVDKLIGWAFLSGRLPLSNHVLMVSGRTSYEILQKAVMAGVPIVCAVSAPSTLAVSVARDFGVTLIGFLRGGRFNVYAGAERVG